MTRDQLLESASAWFDAGHFQRDLARRVAWRTESDGGQPGPALGDYLRDDIVPSLIRLGFDCEVQANPVATGGPLLVARRVEGQDLPTVLTYGHGDVVNGQDKHWREGLSPWQLTVEGDRWYGRGTADNKGQHTINFAALEHTLGARGGRLGYNVTVLLEMGEEAGSPGLRELCERERELLRADLLIACDGPRVQAQQPTLFLGSRGLVNFSLRLQSRERAYHSGNWGGVLTNPGIVLAHAIASMVDERGRIQVDGLRPPALADNIRRALRDVQVGGGTDDPQINPAWGEPGLTAAERLVGWNTLEVLALGAGSAERPVNAIPPQAVAHCQLRFVPGTPWQQLQSIVRAHLDAHGFDAVEVSVTADSPATRLDLDNPWVGWAMQSMAMSSGKPVTLLPNLAGSLPNDVFADVLGLPTLWVPHSYPACAQHAPNEHLLASVASEGLRIMAGLYWDLGEPGLPWQRSARAQ
ncbi:M20 family metallopeptidase [Polaromonas sp. JS666]|uniref:M20 family metallopeptidase n=1 Tax=Polaromonas sp. (strain JS666 / ATCC BAA-500) TaxID=296591 RepID=UPI000046501D|nr:M20 family metallopeptidase [Polaromonas sp. JS666]ABE43657.1 peptidase dimerization [Polaromonas sp. JS666]